MKRPESPRWRVCQPTERLSNVLKGHEIPLEVNPVLMSRHKTAQFCQRLAAGLQTPANAQLMMGGTMIRAIKDWWAARQRMKAWRKMFLAQTGQRWWE